jgi:hypothetical protein
MKKSSFLWLALSMFLLAGCWDSVYNLEIESWDITWNPNLNAEMQVVNFDESNWDIMFQEVSQNSEATLDTLIIAYDYENLWGQNVWLSSYVQSSINQVKDLWNFELSNEKAEKRTIWEYQAILKTYKIKDETRELYVAQEFIELKNKVVVMVSYTSWKSSHVKTFVKELSSLTIEQ